MAITKTIEIDVNSLKAVGGLENLDKALKQVDKSAKGVDATFEETEQGVKVIHGFKNYFTERYGAFILGNGFCVWDIKTSTANVHIELVDDSEYDSFGQFSLNFHKQNDPAFQSPK